MGEPDNILCGFLVARVVTIHGCNIRSLKPCCVQHIAGWNQTLVLVELSLHLEMARISAKDVEVGSIWDSFDQKIFAGLVVRNIMPD